MEAQLPLTQLFQFTLRCSQAVEDHGAFSKVIVMVLGLVSRADHPWKEGGAGERHFLPVDVREPWLCTPWALVAS